VSTWKGSYLQQRAQKLQQLEDMIRFAESKSCRMLYLIKHFGDMDDAEKPCGLCDSCDPESCRGTEFRPFNENEKALARKILATLRERNGLSTGQLFKRSCPNETPDRKSFERILSGLAKTGLLRIEEDSFVKDAQTIHFQRAYLTLYRQLDPDDAIQQATIAVEVTKPARSVRATRKRTEKQAPDEADRAKEPPRQVSMEIVTRLKAWRLNEAHTRKIPAFRILPDRTIHNIAAARPRNEEQLMQVKGIGPALYRKYGRAILGVVSESKS
jgi:superfamily II DNA helicase RecQ